jgi:hypothetical protein
VNEYEHCLRLPALLDRRLPRTALFAGHVLNDLDATVPAEVPRCGKTFLRRATAIVLAARMLDDAPGIGGSSGVVYLRTGAGTVC